MYINDKWSESTSICSLGSKSFTDKVESISNNNSFPSSFHNALCTSTFYSFFTSKLLHFTIEGEKISKNIADYVIQRHNKYKYKQSCIISNLIIHIVERIGRINHVTKYRN